MICDVCNNIIAVRPACLLGTKEVATNKACWLLYLNSLIADKVMSVQAIKDSLAGLVGQMASSDTPWAICESCTTSLIKASFPFRSDKSPLAPNGHALCRITDEMVYLVLDDAGVALAMKMANTAFLEILSGRAL